MLSLVLYVVFLILKAEAIDPETENREIRLSYNNDRNEEFTVWKDKPLRIIIENGYARYIWCVNKYVKPGYPSSEYFVPETEFPNTIVSTLKIKTVTLEMNTRWACTVLQEHHGGLPYLYKNRNYTAKDLHFQLHVKGARQVILTANYYNLTYDVSTNLSVQHYGRANYTYVDGQDIEFSCMKKKNETHPSDTLRLEYFNAEGTLLFQTKSRIQPHKFRSVLKSTNNKYYLDCIYASTKPVREYRYRTTFYVKRDAEEHTIMVAIDGQKLNPILLKDSPVDDYIFKYIDGEILNVTCQNKDSFPKGTLYFEFDPNINYRMGSRRPDIISVKIWALTKINKKAVACGINNTDAKKPIARILFTPEISDYDVRVRGLPRKNILYQYTNDFYQWTIEYQYSVNETLNLTCIYKSGITNSNWHVPEFQWIMKGTSINYTANWTPDLPNNKFSNDFMNVLDTTHNGTKIKCIYYPNGMRNKIKKTVEIILRLKPEIIPEAKSDEVNNSANKDQKVDMTVPIAVTFGVTVAIITMVCLVCWRERTKRVNLIENAYDNLSNQNDSPIPAFPSQWEANCDDSHYANIDEEVMQENYNYSTDNDKLYGMLFKRESNNSENHYTEIDDYFKPRPDGQTINTPSKYNKDINTRKGIASHNCNDAIYNNAIDTKQGTYDRLMHKNLPINKSNDNYSNVHTKGKSKSVTFRQMSTDLIPERNFSEGSKQGRNNDQRFKHNNGGHYANTDQNIYKQPEVMQKKSDYENNCNTNKKAVNPLDLDYAEPYDDLGISCKNDLYG